VFLALLHLFDEGLGLLLINKGQASRAVFELKCMEKCSVLVISKIVVDFLVPDYTSASRLHEKLHCQHSFLIFTGQHN
jgi:hypothetical protein